MNPNLDEEFLFGKGWSYGNQDLKDAVMVLAAAMKKADSIEPATFLPAIAATQHDGVTSQIRFDDKGDLVGGAITLYRIESGKWKPLATIQ